MKILEKAKVEAAKNDVQAEIIYTQGEPAHEILNTAKAKGVCLIVVGSRGHQRPEEMMLCSVSHKVSQSSPCPVLIVR